MERSLLNQFNILEKAREDLLESLFKLDDTLLNTIPKSGKWSPAQVVSHVIQAEELSFKYIEKRMRNATLNGKPGLGDLLKAGFVIFALKWPFKYKAPEMVAEVPDYRTIQELQEQWQEVRFKMKAVLEMVLPEHLHLSLYKHPIAGPMQIGNAMKFMQEHFNRHKKQIEKVLENSIGK